MTRPARLSKSRFIRGIQCTKLLWWSVQEPGTPELAVDSSLQAVFDRGQQVGALARDRFPRGVFVEGDYRDQKGKVERTRRAIADRPPAIFEASFQVNNVFASVDVLERRRGRTCVSRSISCAWLTAAPSTWPSSSVKTRT